MFLIFWITAFCFFCILVNAEIKTYKGHSVLRITTKNQEERQTLENIINQYPEKVEVWRQGHHHGDPVDIRVEPEVKGHLHKRLRRSMLRHQHQTLIRDVESLIDSHSNHNPFKFHINQYNKWDQITEWLLQVNSSCGDLCNLSAITQSTEGRPVYMMKIGGGTSSNSSGAWLDGGMHAREWISVSTALHVINELVFSNKSDPLSTRMLNDITWYITPVVNPDGYVYTWTKDRLWRKTRSKHGEFCRGVDLNRNWYTAWGEEGSSDDECAESYRGPRPFSEPEAYGVALQLWKIRENLKLYISLHSYGQTWLTPWGFTKVLPEDYKKMVSVGRTAIRAAKVAARNHTYANRRDLSDVKYSIGSASNMLYIASGASDDWVKEALNVPYVYTIELPDQGRHAFFLPQRYIQPTAEHINVALRSLAAQILKDQDKI